MTYRSIKSPNKFWLPIFYPLQQKWGKHGTWGNLKQIMELLESRFTFRRAQSLKNHFSDVFQLYSSSEVFWKGSPDNLNQAILRTVLCFCLLSRDEIKSANALHI